MLNRLVSQDRPISSSAFSILEQIRTPLVSYHSRVVVLVFNYLSDFCQGNVPGFLKIFQRGTRLKVVHLVCLFMLAELKDPWDNQTWKLTKPPLFRAFPPATRSHTEATLLFTKLNPKTVGTREHSHTSSMSLILRDSRNGESPTPYQEFGSRTQAVHGSEASYIQLVTLNLLH